MPPKTALLYTLLWDTTAHRVYQQGHHTLDPNVGVAGQVVRL